MPSIGEGRKSPANLDRGEQLGRGSWRRRVSENLGGGDIRNGLPLLILVKIQKLEDRLMSVGARAVRRE